MYALEILRFTQDDEIMVPLGHGRRCKGLLIVSLRFFRFFDTIIGMKFRPELFWDVDPKTINPKKHARYIIERILDFGDDREVRWLAKYYSSRLIKDTIRKSRVLDPKSKSLWALVWR